MSLGLKIRLEVRLGLIMVRANVTDDSFHTTHYIYNSKLLHLCYGNLGMLYSGSNPDLFFFKIKKG